MKRAIKRILMGLTLIIGTWLAAYGIGLVVWHGGTWLASSFADSVIHEQDKRADQVPEEVKARSVQAFLRSK